MNYNQKRKNRRKTWQTLSVLGLVLFFLFKGCRDPQEAPPVPHDPSKPITMASFKPDTARVATQMLIWGTNFGCEKAKVDVTIGDKKAVVIGVNDTLIYCLVPSFKGSESIVTDDEGNQWAGGQVKVQIGNQEVVSAESVVYSFSRNVSTFLGFTDQDGNSARLDGVFEKAQFDTPAWLAFDEDTPEGTDRNFFLIEESTAPSWSNGSVRFVDMQAQEVTTVLRAGGDVGRPRTIAYTLDYDTMIIANDAGGWADIGTLIMVRDPVSRRFSSGWETAMNHKQCNGGAIHPRTGDYWFNSYEKSQVYKVKDRSQIPWIYGNATNSNVNGQEGLHFVFLVQDNGWEFNLQIAPDGSFAYIVCRNKHYVAKTDFDFNTGYFGDPYPFVGMVNKPGYLDGPGLASQFRDPQQGAFDSENNFYLTDSENHCIRKITPTGQVSTFAGRAGSPGYSDGDLRDAQFDSPLGIIYDEINQTFYVADRDNRRIRTIKVE
jgi:DNA-binding beta-propeller fold protein YncE